MYWSVVDCYTTLSSGIKRDIARGLDDHALAALLHRMFENEQLLCFPFDDPSIKGDLFQRLNETKCFKPAVERIMLALDGPRRIENGRILNAEEDHRHTRAHGLVYGLGPRGAPRWEGIANPRWESFIDRDYYEDNSPRRTLKLRGQRERLEQALLLLPHMKIIPGTERWEHFSPWHATYWRTLPQGSHVTFEVDVDLTVRLQHTVEEKRWYEFLSWYTVPDEFKQSGYWS